MSIRSTRTAAAWVAGAGAFWGVFIAASAVLLGSNSLLAMDALLVVAAGASAIALLRSTTLSLEGADVVYRSGRKEQRLPRGEIAGCALGNGAWAFTDVSGTRLLTLTAARFNEADVADFCTHAGIKTSGPSQRPVDRLRRDVSSAKLNRAFGAGLAVLFTAAAGGLIYAQYNSRLLRDEYLAAPVCQPGQSGAGTSCRQQAKATVTSVDQHTGGNTLHLAVTGGGNYIAWLDDPTPNAGDVVDVELWDGDVRLVEGRQTARNPTTDPNLNDAPLAAIPGVIALVCLGVAVLGQYQLVHARASLRIALGPEVAMATPVQKVRPDTVLAAAGLPPCGIQHQPKEQFFAHLDLKRELNGAAILAVIVAIPVALFVWIAILASNIWWAAPAALGVLFLGEQMVELWRCNRDGGIYADDLHVAKIETSFLWFLKRKVYDRKSVLEVRLAGGVLTVVGVDGSTLFYSGLISDADEKRFADFVGGRVVEEKKAPVPDALAVPPVKTPEGVLPLSYRRAAGLLQAIGGLLFFLGIVNLVIRVPSAPADRRVFTLELVLAITVYGALLMAAGFWLARGMPASRELALYATGLATVAVLVSVWMITGSLAASAGFGALFVPIFALVAYWLRQPLARGEAPSPR